MGFLDWSLDDLRRELSSVSTKMEAANEKKKELETAMAILCIPKNDCDRLQRKVKNISNEYSSWKGDLKDLFDQDMTSLSGDIHEAWDEMDTYYNKMDNECYMAKLQSGRYAPIVSEIKWAIGQLI